MSWWESLQTTATEVYDTSLSGASDWFGNQIAEQTTDPATVEGSGIPVRTASSNTEAATNGGMNWQMVGVGIAALGLLFTITRK